MALPRLICKFLCGRRPEGPLLPSVAAAAPPVAAPVQAQEECCCAREPGVEADADCSCPKECWRDHNDLSISTKASCDQAQCPWGLQLGSLESDSEGEIEADSDRTEVRLDCPSLYFYHGLTSEDEVGKCDAKLWRAEHAECDGECGAVVAVVGSNCGRSVSVSESPDSLLLDCRCQADDEPQLVSLVGARLRAGRVKSLRIEHAPHSKGSSPSGKGGLQIVCLCEAPLLMELGHSPIAVPLRQAVEELCEQQVQRSNAKLVAYQREINSRMLGAQRRRMLGLMDPQMQTCR